MSQQGGFTPTPRVKTPLDNSKLNLSAPTPSDPSKKSSLIWGFKANNPNITVYTNEPGDEGKDKDYGKVVAAMDMPIFNQLMILIEDTLSAPRDTKNKIENKNFTFPGGVRSERPTVVSETWVGKDKDGCIWICISKQNRPRIKFVFGSNDFHNFVHGDGTPYTQEETSVMHAKAIVRMLTQMVNHMAITHWEEPKPKQQNGGGNNRGGGNYGNNNGGGNRGNYNNGNQGGYNRGAPPTAGDDGEVEIPF